MFDKYSKLKINFHVIGFIIIMVYHNYDFLSKEICLAIMQI